MATIPTNYNPGSNNNFYSWLGEYIKSEKKKQVERTLENSDYKKFEQEYMCEPIGDVNNNPFAHHNYVLTKELEHTKNELMDTKHRLAIALEQRDQAERLSKEAVEENVELKKRIEKMNNFEKFDIMEMEE